MIPIAYSKSKLFISFFSHTNVDSAILINFLALWRKQLRKFTSLQAGPAPSLSEGLCQNLVVPFKLLCKSYCSHVFKSCLHGTTVHMRVQLQWGNLSMNFWGPLTTRNSFLCLINSWGLYMVLNSFAFQIRIATDYSHR